MFVNPNVNERLGIIASIKKAIPYPVQSDIDLKGTNIHMAWVFVNPSKSKYIRIVFFDDSRPQITVEQLNENMVYISNAKERGVAIKLINMDLSSIYTGDAMYNLDGFPRRIWIEGGER